MVRIKKLALAALVALALAAGGLVTAEPPTYQSSFIDDEEIIEQVASSQGDQAVARESSIAWAAPEEAQIAGSKGCGPGGGASFCDESSSLPTTPDELQQVAGSAGSSAKIVRESA